MTLLTPILWFVSKNMDKWFREEDLNAKQKRTVTAKESQD